jgi:hypothetical protein
MQSSQVIFIFSLYPANELKLSSTLISVQLSSNITIQCTVQSLCNLFALVLPLHFMCLHFMCVPCAAAVGQVEVAGKSAGPER